MWWRILLGLMAVCSLAGGVVHGGEYHNAEQGSCSDCHSAHASMRGESWTPAAHLLKNPGGQVPLCMSCHDGTNPQAPDIVSSGTAASPTSFVSTLYTSKYGSSAGFFQSDYLVTANPCGHDMAPSSESIAPLSTTYRKPGGLVCTDCHDSHGNGNYRNLISDPNPAHPGSYPIIIGTNVKETTAVNAQSPNPAAAYDTANVSFSVQSNITAWCADCHDKLAQNSTASSTAHFRSHPSDVAIGGIGAHTDVANWMSGANDGNSGFGLDVGDSAPGIPRLRHGSPSLSNSAASSGDTVFCLSCHKAHGSQYKYGLVWPLHQGGTDGISGCQQCHNK